MSARERNSNRGHCAPARSKMHDVHETHALACSQHNLRKCRGTPGVAGSDSESIARRSEAAHHHRYDDEDADEDDEDDEEDDDDETEDDDDDDDHDDDDDDAADGDDDE